MNEVIQKAAEFGFASFVLVLVLIGVAFWIWTLTNRLSAEMSELIKTTNATSVRNTEAIEKISEAVDRISKATDLLAIQSNEWKLKQETIERMSKRHTQTTRIVIDTLHDLVPGDKTRTILMLEEAKRNLDQE